MRVNCNVKRGFVVGCLIGAIFVIASAKAETTPGDSNPYAIISDRNVFHLNPPPPPPAPEAPKPPDLPPVKLSGFQRIGDHMKVYLAIPAKDPKDTAYLSLQEGEMQSDVKIVAIRADKGEVDILNTGTPQTLNLLSNGFALSGGAPAPAARPNPGIPMPMHHMPGMPFPQPTAIVPPSMPVSTQGSAMVIGGSSDSGGVATIGGSPSVSGGNSFVQGGAAPITAAAAAPPFGSVGQVVPGGANSASAQIANSLFSGGQYHIPPSPNITPAPLDNQKAGILIQGAAGGPPVPPSIINEYNGGPPGPQ
jgi:hypothetical protein